MISENERKNREEMFRLMQENPKLPVIPMVDGEIPGDDCGYWLGAWGHATVDEYLICKRYEYVALKSDDDVFDVLEKYLTDEEFEHLPASEKKCRTYYDALPWTKAILVYITTRRTPDGH